MSTAAPFKFTHESSNVEVVYVSCVPSSLDSMDHLCRVTVVTEFKPEELQSDRGRLMQLKGMWHQRGRVLRGEASVPAPKTVFYDISTSQPAMSKQQICKPLNVK